MPPRKKQPPPSDAPGVDAKSSTARSPEYVDACLLHAVNRKNSRWVPMRKKGATDRDIIAVLRDVFGDNRHHGEPQGADGSPGICYWTHGGSKPRLWLERSVNGKDATPPTLEGKALVDAVRRILEIPTPEQAEARTESVLQSAESILADARRKAQTIRRLREDEEDLKGQLKELRESIDAETDGLNTILLDVERGQSRLNFDAKPTATTQEAPTKQEAVPLTTTFVAVDGNRTLTARQAVAGKWTVRDEQGRPLAVDQPLAKAQAAALAELGIKRAEWKRVDAPADAPKAPTQSALAKEAERKKAPKDGRVAMRCVLPMVAVLTVEPATDGWDAFIQDEGVSEQVHIGNFADIENAKRELLHEADWSGATPEWKPVEAAAGSGKAA